MSEHLQGVHLVSNLHIWSGLVEGVGTYNEKDCYISAQKGWFEKDFDSDVRTYDVYDISSASAMVFLVWWSAADHTDPPFEKLGEVLETDIIR